MRAARAELESLLRARKLDVTLTSADGGRPPDPERLAPTGWPVLDAHLGGGIRRGHVSEVIGARSSGRSTLACAMAAAATARGEAVAVIDTHDRFDPAAAHDAGVDLARLLWIREAGHADRALKAMNLVLQAGGFGVVAIDLADVPPAALRQIPFMTWLRVQRAIEGSDTACVLLTCEPLARSAGGLTVSLTSRATWAGTSDRSRRLAGVDMRARVVSPRKRIDGTVTFRVSTIGG